MSVSVPPMMAMREIALRVLHFAGREREVGKSVVRPQHADQRQAQTACGGARRPAWPTSDRTLRRGSDQRHRRGDEHPSATNFAAVAMLTTAAPDPAEDVSGGGEGNGGRREHSRADDMADRIDPERPQQVLAEDDRDSAERGRTKEDELGPAEEKRDGTAPTFAEVGVEAARVGQRRRQFGERQRAAERDEPASDPQADHDRRARDDPRDPGRRPEDAGADGDADDEGDRLPAERARQRSELVVGFMGVARLRTEMVGSGTSTIRFLRMSLGILGIIPSGGRPMDVFKDVVTSEEELREVLGTPGPRSVLKERAVLDEHSRAFISCSPLLLMATAGQDGRCDVSPKGDAPGFVLVLDDHRLVIPDRPGNKRLDSMCNLLVNPHVGLIFLVPGREERCA